MRRSILCRGSLEKFLTLRDLCPGQLSGTWAAVWAFPDLFAMPQQRQRRPFARRLPQYRSVCVLALQKRTDRLADLAGMGFQREMAGVQEAHCRIGNVALERFGAGRQE